MITFRVPLPPPSLRGNSRAHWSRKKKDADEYSERVWCAFNEQTGANCYDVWRNGRNTKPWKKARVHYEWRYAGVEPDHGNLGGHTKYLQDMLCMAPRGAAGRDRWYLGLVEDDRGITATYEAVKVKRRAEEAVVVTIECMEDGR